MKGWVVLETFENEDTYLSTQSRVAEAILKQRWKDPWIQTYGSVLGYLGTGRYMYYRAVD